MSGVRCRLCRAPTREPLWSCRTLAHRPLTRGPGCGSPRYMGHGTKVTTHGAFVVLRDAKGNRLARATAQETPRKSWRSLLREITDNGVEQFTILRELSLGKALVTTLPNGQESEPVIPSAEVRRAAARDLLEFLHGKPVAQTEVAHAEAETRLLEQVQSLTDAELEARVRDLLERGEVVDGQIAKSEGPLLPDRLVER